MYSFRPHTEKKRMLTLWEEPIRSGKLIVLTCRIRQMVIPTHGSQDSDCNKNFHDRFRLGLKMVHSLSIFTPRKLSGKLGNELETIGLIKPYSRNSCSFGWLINILGHSCPCAFRPERLTGSFVMTNCTATKSHYAPFAIGTVYSGTRPFCGRSRFSLFRAVALQPLPSFVCYANSLSPVTAKRRGSNRLPGAAASEFF